jgi:hypothetical protein
VSPRRGTGATSGVHPRGDGRRGDRGAERWVSVTVHIVCGPSVVVRVIGRSAGRRMSSQVRAAVSPVRAALSGWPGSPRSRQGQPARSPGQRRSRWLCCADQRHGKRCLGVLPSSSAHVAYAGSACPPTLVAAWCAPMAPNRAARMTTPARRLRTVALMRHRTCTQGTLWSLPVSRLLTLTG